MLFSQITGSKDEGTFRYASLITIIEQTPWLKSKFYARDYITRITLSNTEDITRMKKWILALRKTKEFKGYAHDPYFYIGESYELKSVSLIEVQGLLRKIALFLFLKSLKLHLGTLGVVLETRINVSGAIQPMLDILNTPREESH